MLRKKILFAFEIVLHRLELKRLELMVLCLLNGTFVSHKELLGQQSADTKLDLQTGSAALLENEA